MQVQMNPLSFLWWRLGKKASKPAAVIPQKPDHNLIRIFASSLSYSNSEPQKSRYDISTSKAGHKEKIRGVQLNIGQKQIVCHGS